MLTITDLERNDRLLVLDIYVDQCSTDLETYIRDNVFCAYNDTNGTQDLFSIPGTPPKEVPEAIDLTAKPFRRKVKYARSISINSYASASLWDGKPKTASHYA